MVVGYLCGPYDRKPSPVMINQASIEADLNPICFGGKIHNERQQKYVQVKRELWGIVSAIKIDREYLIKGEIVIETDCLLVLGMMWCCTIPDVAMLRWTASIMSLNPEMRYISGKDNAEQIFFQERDLGVVRLNLTKKKF